MPMKIDDEGADAPAADVGVFGGSGFYRLLDDAAPVDVASPWGEPSGQVTIGTVDGVRVAFLPRHGPHHEIPPHRVNYRANVDVMRRLGVCALLSPFACGSLRAEMKPGHLVVVNQFVDRTSGRDSTFHDRFDAGPAHAAMADPYDERLRKVLLDSCRTRDITVHDGATVVVVNGPRFSTRAESEWHRTAGWHLVNMTQCPEVPLAVEAGIPIAGLGVVTDHDAGLAGDPDVAAVTQEEVFAVFERTIAAVRDVVLTAVPGVIAAVGGH